MFLGSVRHIGQGDPESAGGGAGLLLEPVAVECELNTISTVSYKGHIVQHHQGTKNILELM